MIFNLTMELFWSNISKFYVIPRCDTCEALDKFRERASSHQNLTLATELKHILRYSGARVEIDRVIQLSIQDPKQMLSISLDGMDNKKVGSTV